MATVPFVLGHRESRISGVEHLSLRRVVAGLWIDPKENPDFAWAFGGPPARQRRQRPRHDVLPVLPARLPQGRGPRREPLRDVARLPRRSRSSPRSSAACCRTARGDGGPSSPSPPRLQGTAGILIVLHPTYESALVGAALHRRGLRRLHVRRPGAGDRGAPGPATTGRRTWAS